MGFYVVTPSMQIVASHQEQGPLLRSTLDGYRLEFVRKVLHGPAAVSLPFRSTVLLPDAKGELKVGVPTMYVAAAIPDERGEPLGVLVLRMRPEAEFTAILQSARFGQSGETYAFSDAGVLLLVGRHDLHRRRVRRTTFCGDSSCSRWSGELHSAGTQVAPGVVGDCGAYGEAVMNYPFLQAWVLRLVGSVEMLAFGAVIMPRSWMAATNAALGLPEMPTGPVFDSVMRQVSFSYGLHGVALWFIAADVARYRSLVILTAVGYLLAGPVFLLIDFANGMPISWTGGNGGSCLLIGTLLSGLLLGERVAGPHAPRGAVG